MSETSMQPDAAVAAGEQMDAIEQHRYGDDLETVLSSARRPVPRPEPGEVLVAVEAAAVSRAVWHLATGRPYVARLALGLRRPKARVPGMDLSGQVVAVGRDVTRWSPGDTVLGAGRGAYAEFAVAAADALVRRPEGLPAAEAAALIDSGCTAWQALHRHARVTAGDRVLVIGASGGVGCYAVQLAAGVGASVTAVASGAKLAFVRGLGVEDTIDYRREEIDARGVRYDVVLDIAGNRPLRLLRRVLTPNGRLVIVGGEGGGPVLGGLDRLLRARIASVFSAQQLGGMYATPTAETLDALVDRHERGALRPVVTRSYRLEEAGHALNQLAAGALTGKAVILPHDGRSDPPPRVGNWSSRDVLHHSRDPEPTGDLAGGTQPDG